MTGRRLPAPSPTTRSGRVASAAAALVATVLALATVVLAVPAGAAAPGAHAPSVAVRSRTALETAALPVHVSLAGVTPVALTPASVLTVTGTIRNTGRETLAGLRVNLRLDWKQITDRRELAEWAGLPALDERVGTLWERQLLTDPLPPGASAPFTVTGKADSLALPVSAAGFGPRGMTVEVQDQVAGTLRRVGIVRTFEVWNPVPQYTPTQLAMLVPVTSGSGPVGADGTDPSLAAQWHSGGRLSRVLTATTDGAFSYAVDPALLSAGLTAQNPAPAVTQPASTPSTKPPAAAGGGQPAGASTATVTPTPASTGSAGSAGSGAAKTTTTAGASYDPQTAADANAWIAQLAAARSRHDTLKLPYGDPDVAALAHGGDGDLLDLADSEASTVTATAFGRALPGNLVWPFTGRTDLATAGLAAHKSDRTMVLSTSAVPIAPAGGAAQAHVRLSVPGGDADAVLVDDAMSAALGGIGGPDSVVATQRLLAETAAITAAHPTLADTLIAAAPRTWNPDPTAVQSAIATLHAAGWVTTLGIADVQEQTPVTVPRSKLVRPSEATAAQELPASHVQAVAADVRRLQVFARALTDADARSQVGPGRQLGLGLLSVARIGNRPASLVPPRVTLANQVNGLYGRISVVAGSSANLLTRSGQLPVTVANTLPVPVHVVLTMHARSGQVQVDGPIDVHLEAARSSTVRVRIRAVANGDAQIVSRLTAPGAGNAELGRAPTITIHVHFDWETRGLFWIGVLLALLLVAGLVRSVRRPRERVSPDAVPDPDDVGRDPPPSGPIGPIGESDPAAQSDSAAPADQEDPADQAEPADPAAPAAPVAMSIPGPDGALAPPVAGLGVIRAGSVAVAARPTRRDVVVERIEPNLQQSADQVQAVADSDLEVTAATHAGSPSGPGAVPPAGGRGEGFRAGGTGGTGDADGADGADDRSAAQPPPADAAGAARLLSSSALMAAGTLVSRVLGVVRVVVLAWAIGATGLSADAFATANTLPNSLMILLAGGVLNAVLVPQIIRAARQPDGGKNYLDRLLTLAITLLGAATVVAVALAPVLVRLFGSGRWTPAQLELATAFALWCLPQIFFYGLYTIYGQVLNARGSFGPYMWAPVVNNIVAIAGTLVFVSVAGSGQKSPGWWSPGTVALLGGTATLGIVAQALVLIPSMRRSGYSWRPTWGFRGIGLRTAGRVAGWTFAAAAVGQLGFIFVSRAANTGGARGAAAGVETAGRNINDLAYQLFILPHSLVAVSIVTTVFTRMSISASAGRTDEVRADASLAVRLTGVATVLATVAFVVLGRDLAQALFVGSSRGETDSIALATGAMILGVVPFSAQYLFSRIFYAYEDARTPFAVQVIVVVLWAGGSLLSAALLAPAWVVPGIGLAMSVSNLVGAAVSVLLLRRRIGGVDGARVLRTHVRLIVGALVAGVVGWFVSAGVHGALGTGRSAALLALIAGGSSMLLCYGSALKLMKVEEFDLLTNPVLRRVRRV